MLILLKYILATAMLYLAYRGTIGRCASYRFRRNYLLLIPLLGLMGTLQFRLTVTDDTSNPTPAAPEVVEFSMADVPDSTPSSLPFTLSSSADAPVTTITPIDTLPSTHSSLAQNRDRWLAMLLAAVSIAMLLFGVWQMGHLLIIRARLPKQRTPEGYDLIRSAEVATPFSFARTIFLPAYLDAQRETLVLMHEKAHIGHRHYLEVWMANLLTALAWFNPVVWLCRAELLKVHEFEADSDVLRGGVDRYDYQMSLLQMSVNVNCTMVSGFSQSLIRQRFVEMKDSMAGTLSRRGKWGLAAWITALFGVFAAVGCQVSVKHESDMANGDIFATFDAVPRLEKPEPFTFAYICDSLCTDTVLYIFLSDDFFHFSNPVPTDTLHAKDGKMIFQKELDHVIGMKCSNRSDISIGAGGSEMFCVPGEILLEHTSHGMRAIEYINYDSYRQKKCDYVDEFRKLTRWDSPHMPHFDCARWEEPDCEVTAYLWHNVKKVNEQAFFVKNVFFADTATILHIVYYDPMSAFNFYDDTCTYLMDVQGNKYKYIKTIYPSYHLDARVFGTYGVFEPINPNSVKSFSLMGPKPQEATTIKNIRPREAGALANATLPKTRTTTNSGRECMDFETLCATYGSTPGIEHIKLTGMVRYISELGLKPDENTDEEVRRAEQLVVNDPKLAKQVFVQTWADSIPKVKNWRGSCSARRNDNKCWTALRFAGDTLIVTYAETCVVPLPPEKQDSCKVIINGKHRPELKTKQQGEAWLRENNIGNYTTSYWDTMIVDNRDTIYEPTFEITYED